MTQSLIPAAWTWAMQSLTQVYQDMNKHTYWDLDIIGWGGLASSNLNLIFGKVDRFDKHL